MRHLMPPRSREYRDCVGWAVPTNRRVAGSVARVVSTRVGGRSPPYIVLSDFVEEGVADEFRSDAASAVPVVLERQTAQHAVNKAAHFPNAPRSPRPELRREIIEDRNAEPLSFAGDPPVETGKIDENDGVGPFRFEVTACLLHELVEPPQERNHAENAHHREIGQPKQRAKARLLH